MDTTLTVYIVDDDPAFLESLSLLVSTMVQTVSGFTSVEAFLDEFDPTRPGCILLDIHLPNFDGLKLQELFSRQSIDVPIVIVSGTTNIKCVSSAFRQGAVAFLQKANFSESELREALSAAIARDATQRKKNRRREEICKQRAKLTTQEQNVLRLTLTGKETNDIASELKVTQLAVESHLADLMQKLEVSNLSQLIKLDYDSNALGISLSAVHPGLISPAFSHKD